MNWGIPVAPRVSASYRHKVVPQHSRVSCFTSLQSAQTILVSLSLSSVHYILVHHAAFCPPEPHGGGQKPRSNIFYNENLSNKTEDAV